MSLMRARMEEALSPYGAAFLYADADAAVFSCPARHARREILGALKTLMVSLNGLLMSRHKVSVSVALSGPCDAPQFALGHAACLTALEHRLYLGPCQALDAPLFEKPPSVPYIPYDEATLRAQVRVFSYAGASKRLEALFARLRHERLGDVRAARALCASLKRLLYETLRDKGIDMEALLAENPDIFDEPRNFVLLDDYYAWCDTLYYLVLGGLNQLSGRASSRCTVQAVDYIARHLGENLSLESVAEAVGKSKNYFSFLFKREMGVSFVDYLSAERVERAKKLLTTTDLMTYEIAGQVGFSDYKYFSAVFKRHVGCSPAQYRKQQS